MKSASSVTRLIKVLSAIIVIVVSVFASRADAQINVFIDYANFSTRLDEATGAAGVANFNAAEISTIQSNIFASLSTAFIGYEVNFSETNPGGTFETLTFGLTGGGFGVADRIDFRNQVATDTARVFTGNFSSFLEVADPRAIQISELSNSLSGTAAHEVGHNIGLEHRDAYGITGIGIADGGGGHATGGLQNTRIMATGITGLGEAQRETPRSFSDISHVKLEFANGVVTNPLSTTAEQGGAHSTFGSAQQVAFSDLDVGISDFDKAAVIEGTTVAGEDDFYSIELNVGEFATFEIISQVIFGDDVDSVMTLFDTDGVSQLALNDDTTVSGGAINQGGSIYSRDSSIYNFLAPTTGEYFVRVAPFGAGDNGSYELLFAATSFVAVPEPASVGLLSLVAICLAGTRRRRKVT